jgi:hypothetical protein
MGKGMYMFKGVRPYFQVDLAVFLHSYSYI